MDSANQPFLVRVDTKTGEIKPISFESAYGDLVRQEYVYGIVPRVPAEYLFIGRKYIALGLEQGGLNRVDLYVSLLHDGILKSIIALEASLRDVLERGKNRRLDQLLDEAVRCGVISNDEGRVTLRNVLKKLRNDTFHGNSNPERFTGSIPDLYRLIVDDVNTAYARRGRVKRRASD